MALNKEDKSFKILISKEFTSPDRFFYQEYTSDTIILDSGNVWTTTIPSSSNEATASNIAVKYEKYNLVADLVYPTNAFYFQSDTSSYNHDNALGGFISDKYGTDYEVKLYDATDTQIFKTDTINWNFDYVTGILHVADPGSYTLPYNVTVYKYTGETVGEAVGTASYVSDPYVAYINKSNYFTGSQYFDNTGSFAHINITGSDVGDNSGIDFYGKPALTANPSDGWLRLNNANQFTDGVYIRGDWYAPDNARIGNNLADIHRITGSLYQTGSIIVANTHDDLTIGNQLGYPLLTTSTTLFFGASDVQFIASCLPASDNNYYFGTATRRWSQFWATTGSFSELIATGSLLITGSFEFVSASLKFGDGDTGIYESADDILRFWIAGIDHWYMDADEFRPTLSYGPKLLKESPSATNPNFVFNLDEDTGIGRADANTGSLIAGGVNVMNWYAGGVDLTGDLNITGSLIINGDTIGDLENVAYTNVENIFTEDQVISGSLNILADGTGVPTPFKVQYSATSEGLPTDLPNYTTILSVRNNTNAFDNNMTMIAGTSGNARITFGTSESYIRGAIDYDHLDDTMRFYTTNVAYSPFQFDRYGSRLGILSSDIHNITGSVVMTGSLNVTGSTVLWVSESDPSNAFFRVVREGYGIVQSIEAENYYGWLEIKRNDVSSFIGMSQTGYYGVQITDALVFRNDQGFSFQAETGVANKWLTIYGASNKMEVSASTEFGYDVSNNHWFTGSVHISGSFYVNEDQILDLENVAYTNVENQFTEDQTITGSLTLTGSYDVNSALIFGNGNDYIFAATDAQIRVAIDNAAVATFTSAGIVGGSNAGQKALVRDDAATATLPGFAFVSDTATGMGKAGFGTGSLIANGVNVVNWLSNGYVGIGNQNPLYELHVTGDIGVPSGNAIQFSTTLDHTKIERSATYNALVFHAGSSEQMFLTDSGRLGIGFNAPSYSLDVNGTSRIDGALYVGSTAQNGRLDIIDSNGTTYSLKTGDIGNHWFQLQSWPTETPASTTNHIIINNTGKFGIKANPTASIDLGADTRITGITWITGSLYVDDVLIDSNKIYPSYSAEHYLNADSDDIALYVNNVRAISCYDTNVQAAKDFIPWNNHTLDLGSATRYWKFGYIDNLYISSSNTLITLDSGNNLSFTDANAGTITLSEISGAVAVSNSLDLDNVAYTNVNNFFTADQSITGSIYITDHLSASTKSFLINHPVKPGKKLQYGSLEGPEYGVYHRGKIENTNIIELPDYWSHLIDENSITVQLTPMNKWQKLYVKKIIDNKVIIGKMGFGKIKCFYLVHAERKDVGKLEVEK